MAKMAWLCWLLVGLPCLAYDERVGLSLAYLEKAVYCGKEHFMSWDVGESIRQGPKVDTTKLRYVSSSTSQAAAGVGKMLEPKGCFVAIRGTYGTISSLLDAAFWLTSFGHELCPGCEVVAGFHLAYVSIKDALFQALEDFGCQQEPLYLVGHSQGAASLTYFLFDALVKRYTIQHMYALESPRPGNALFGQALRVLLGNIDAWRVSHYQDLVVHLPPRGPMLYEHALPEIYYEARNGRNFKECGVEDSSCSARWWPWQLTAEDHDWYADIDPCSCGITQHAVALTQEPAAKMILVA
mmetsp:Transcript_36809/g.68529  ORF Transcript_36809/g.68529 Transcript_36809/m.68529 type:complete len:297 (-) Transcript_36809:155-1045(-)